MSNKASAAAWKQALVAEYEFEMNGQTLAIQYQSVDVLEVIASDAGNPLLGALQASMNGQGSNPLAVSKPEDMAAIAGMLNKLLVKAIVEPKLIEQGHEEGVSVANIPFSVKLELFSRLIGGGVIDQLEQFRQKPPQSMVTRQ